MLTADGRRFDPLILISAKGVFSMNRTKPGFLALILLFGATLLVPMHRSDIAGAAPAWMDHLTIVQLFNSPTDYRWQGTWDPVYDYDWQRHYNYNCAFVRDCDRCAARDYDRDVVHSCLLCTVPDRGRCDLSPYSNYYRCDLFSCGWVR